MARATAARKLSARPLVKVGAAVAGIALLAGLAVVAQGYDAQEVPRLETSVWVTKADGQYARVNTELAELDTVRSVGNPTDVVQAGDRSLVYTEGNGQLWTVDSSNPVNLTEGAVGADGAGKPATSSNTPAGTRDIVSAGPYVLYRTETGSVFLSVLDDSGTASDVAIPVNPFGDVVVAEGEKAPTYSATAVAISDDGQVVLYSSSEKAIRRFDATTLKFVGGTSDVASPPKADSTGLALAIVGSKWILSAPTESLVWVDGQSDPIDTGLKADAKLQTSSSTGTVAYLADSSGLAGVDLGSGAVSEVTTAAGIPAQPLALAGVVYAAWLTADAGRLWSSATGETTALETESDVLSDEQAIEPVFRSNGQRAVLNETASGMVWTVPDGALIPVAQWTVNDETQENTGTVVVDDVAEEKPPVAVADSFGVRSGAQVSLPLLLNDHDPNKKDVLSISADSTAGGLSDGGFGSLGLAANNQQAVVSVAAGAGSATFTYSVTDGSAVSDPAPVTLTVIPADQNSAPVWCGVESCKQEWPSPQISPGGTVTIPVLSGWVDPEGDPFVLSDARAENSGDPVSVVATADGRVAVRHNDPNASSAAIPIVVTVTDSLGASAEKVLTLVVSSSPALDVSPIVLVAGAGEKTTVKVNDHVTGGSGAYRVVDAVASTNSADLLVVPNAAAGTVELTAARPGEYGVTYSVQDATTLTEQSAVIRLTVPEAGVPLSIAPVTAFVRANEDTTIDILGAVQNSTGRVLIVSQATTGDAALSVSVVGQSQVRVSGTTPTGAGRVGTALVTITDGAGSSVIAQLTVFQVPSSTDSFPITVPDSVTVRAGGQVDIPVLANDLSPRGERLVLHPQIIGSETPGELAFAASDVVRYLAPTTPGVYVLRYSAYLESRPDSLGTATIAVTVIPDGANRSPQPSILTARALSGQTVSIPVSGYGVDPDGDGVVLASVDQPGAGEGVASISAEGDAILYTAPAAGVQGGQVSFAYSVRDTSGAEGSALVRVGVLSNTLSDTTPITYGDYVRTPVNAPNPITVTPLLNDRDPSQGSLSIINLVPNAVPGSAEYDLLDTLVDRSKLDEGIVTLRSGAIIGTHSYIYSVQSSISTSTADGLIVVNVSDVAAPDFPVVTDTVLTARTRLDLASSGVDVVTGKVQWPSGDVASLTLDLWAGAPGGFTVNGSTIKGDLPPSGALIPFSLTGADSGGNVIVSYGFLRIPAFEDMRVQVRTNVEPVEVNEEKSVEFALRDLLDINRSDSIEIRDDDSFAVQRTNASCGPTGSSAATYSAGREAPWVDSCTVPVRLAGQTTWTMVAVPVDILPKDPQAILNAVSRTIAPSKTETIDILADMTTWEGGRVGDTKSLQYTVSQSGAPFGVTQNGNKVSIQVRADAPPGTRTTLEVHTDAYGGLTSAITLIVGVAAPDTPRGATVNKTCTVSAGPCSITVTGLDGEYDPLKGAPGDGLKVTAVSAGTCAVASVAVQSTTQVVATYPSSAKPLGGTCTMPFTVADGQGRTGTGQLTIDVQGYPATPATVSTTAYTGTSVTLFVTLGSASQSHPDVTGVVLYENGAAVPQSSCATPSSTGAVCTVNGLVNGEKHFISARAVNSVGESGDTTTLPTWAYAPPELTAAITYVQTPYGSSNKPTVSQGKVTLNIQSGSDVASYSISGSGNPAPTSLPKSGNDYVVSLSVGTQNLNVVPISRFQPPIGDPNNNAGAPTGVTVNVIGQPRFPGGEHVDPTSDGVRTFVGAAEGNGTGIVNTQYYIGSSAVTCTTSDGTSISPSGGQADPQFTGLPPDESYVITACSTNGFGIAQASAATTTIVRGPQPAGNDLTYGVSTSHSGNNTWTWDDVSYPDVENRAKWTLYYYVNGGPGSTSLDLSPSVAVPVGGVQIRFCSNLDSSVCTDPTTLGVKAGYLPTMLTVTWPSCPAPSSPSPSDVTWSNSAAGFAVSQTPNDGFGSVDYAVAFSLDFAALNTQTKSVGKFICL